MSTRGKIEREREREQFYFLVSLKIKYVSVDAAK